MTATVVFNQNNVPAPVAPPTYFISGNAQTPANGSAVPVGQKRWLLEIDTTGLPAGQLLGNIGLEYQRTAAWTDAAGVQHPANEWLNDASNDLQTGPQGKSGGNIASMGSSIGARDSNGNMIEPYPSNFRFRVESCPGYAHLANVKLTLFDTF